MNSCHPRGVYPAWPARWSAEPPAPVPTGVPSVLRNFGLCFLKLSRLDLLAQSRRTKGLELEFVLAPPAGLSGPAEVDGQDCAAFTSHLSWALHDLFFRSLKGCVYSLYSLMRRQEANRWILHITPPPRCAQCGKTVILLGEVQRIHRNVL